MVEKVEEVFPGVFRVERKLATRNLAPGRRVYGEELVRVKGVEYRLWEPSRSKLGAALVRGLKNLPVRPGARVLYLGAASGTTVSHVSDIVGERGTVYAVEFAPQSMRDLLSVVEARPNILPLLRDARKPAAYADAVGEPVDVIFEDVADPQQARILIENGKEFLRKGGWALLAVKSRSVDVTLRPEEIYARVLQELEPHFELVERLDLAPFEEDHAFLVLRKR
jgi:fibrillarin-like pre-rRNA processing protein